MGLVEYPSSSSDSEEEEATASLPPLPSSFRDLYSSTVRTSTQDDPELHGGRRRVTPHIAGNWPAHIYLEWTPQRPQQNLLSNVLDSIRSAVVLDDVHSLIENDLGVPLPLHVSLSRPLTLKTAHKDTFLSTLTASVEALNIRSFPVSPNTLTWHPNEDRTRWFLVLGLQRPGHDELRRLLGVCNRVARESNQALLYAEEKGPRDDSEEEKFHVSVAWSLVERNGKVEVPAKLRGRLTELKMEFEHVKVRIGQDVTSIALGKRRETLFPNQS